MLQGHGKKMKDLQYGPFEIQQKVGDNTYILSLWPYACIYSMVNVENFQLYEPPMLDEEGEHFLPSIENLSPNSQRKLIEDIIL